MLTRLRAVWRNLPPAVRAGVTTAWQTFAGAALLLLLNLLDAVTSWVEGGDPIDWSAQGRAVTSLVVALASGVVTAVYRSIRPPAASYPDAELTEG